MAGGWVTPELLMSHESVSCKIHKALMDCTATEKSAFHCDVYSRRLHAISRVTDTGSAVQCAADDDSRLV